MCAIERSSTGRLLAHTRHQLAIKFLASDYDGTISLLDAPRAQSQVPPETFEVLQKIAQRIPIAIITTKDLVFVAPRTSFAHAWSGMCGLETKIGTRIRLKKGLKQGVGNVALALEYAKSHLNGAVEIEEKRDASCRTVAFCVDWRRAKDVATAIRQAEDLETYCRQLELYVTRHQLQPFFDVYPTSVDKGSALVKVLTSMNIKEGVLYMGDSEMDNPAFDQSDVSIGVIHEENCMKSLNCDFYVKFQNVPVFLLRLLENNLVFESKFPMIQTNDDKVR